MTLAPKKPVAFLAVSLVGCEVSTGSSTLTDASGATLGRLRFSGTDGALDAALSHDGEQLATGTGTYDATAKSFTLALTTSDGTALGGVSGLYAEPSYAARGSYSGHLACP